MNYFLKSYEIFKRRVPYFYIFEKNKDDSKNCSCGLYSPFVIV